MSLVEYVAWGFAWFFSSRRSVNMPVCFHLLRLSSLLAMIQFLSLQTFFVDDTVSLASLSAR